MLSLIQDQQVQHFLVNQEDFTKFISAYKLTFEEQLEFNKEFGIEANKPSSNSAEALKIFLRDKLNQAFQNQDKLIKYKDAISAPKESSNRGIHDGFHVSSVALYAKNLLKIYQQNKDLFDEKTQKEIEEFDDPKKVRDLEILCLMHDVARVYKYFDQNEYKNAFYVALMLREMGDERFQGNEISEEGLKMIMNLASKESNGRNKSLMSKLIQASDSLAIVRSPDFRDRKTSYNFELNDVFKDFSDIHFNCAKSRDRLKKSIRELVSHVSEIERNPEILLENLEFQSNPQQIFLEHIKTQLLMNGFEQASRLLKSDDYAEAFPSHYLNHPYYVHVVGKHSPYPLDKQGQRFICATVLSSQGVVRGYSDRSWRNNPVLIMNPQSEDGIVFLAGFKTDVGSDSLKGQNFASNIDASFWVQMNLNPNLSKSYFDKLIYTEEEMQSKIQEMMLRRQGLRDDISDGIYALKKSISSIPVTGRVGKDRYQEEYSKPHHEIRTDSGELRHNEMHIFNSTHIMNFVGIARDVFEHNPEHKTGKNSDFSHFGLLRMKFYADQINAEKKRLLSLRNPMEDEKFKNCVEFELSRVTNIFEKIAHLKKLKQELEDDPNHPLVKKSLEKKVIKKSEHEGFEFLKTPENSEAIRKSKITKFETALEILYKNLEEFEKPESFGFVDLKKKADEFCQKENISEEIKKWKSDIMSGVSDPEKLQIAISKVMRGLQIKTEMALYDIFNTKEIKILSDEEYQKKFAKTPELFRELCERKDYSTILLLFSKKEINDLSKNDPNRMLRDGSDLPNYQTIFFEKIQNISPSELGLLIKMGLDIYKMPDESDNEEYQIQCEENFRHNSDENKLTYCCAPYRAPEPYFIFNIKRKDQETIDKLLKFGLLFSAESHISSYSRHDSSENKMSKFMNFLNQYSGSEHEYFKNQLIEVLEKFKTEADLSNMEVKLKFLLNEGAIKNQSHDVTLNGYGLLKMFDRYKEKLVTGDEKMAELFEKLEILRGLKPSSALSTQSVDSTLVHLGPPQITNSMQ